MFDDDTLIKKKSLKRIKKAYREEIDLLLLKATNRPESDFKEYEEHVLDWTTPMEMQKEGEINHGCQKDKKEVIDSPILSDGIVY